MVFWSSLEELSSAELDPITILHQIRNPNIEIRNKSKTQISNVQNLKKPRFFFSLF